MVIFVTLGLMFKMDPKLIIFETTKKDGIMSRNPKFYSSHLTQQEIDEIFLQTRIKLGKKYHFNGTQIFQAQQKNTTNNIQYPNGKYIVISEKNLTKKDYWYEQLPADILMISSKYPNIVIGHQTADCPIVIAEDRKQKVAALCHCGAIQINRELPKQLIESLIKECNSSKKDIYIYIASCAKKEHYIYDNYPHWATNKILWKQYIIEKDNQYHIDLSGAIIKQLKEMDIQYIRISQIDTIKDIRYASHYALVHGDKTKIGQNFVGLYYKI